jgi:small subunit ribosomal protein S17
MANKREVIGTVLRNKVDKAVIVGVERRVRDSVYGKIRRRTTKFMAHDEANSAKVGDRVVMVESRPLSRRKRFVVSRVLERANTVRADK